MNNIRAINKKPPPDQGLILELERLLQAAKDGELAALAGVAEYHNGDVEWLTEGDSDWWGMSARLRYHADDIIEQEMSDDE